MGMLYPTGGVFWALQQWGKIYRKLRRMFMRQFKRYRLMGRTIEEISEQRPCTGKILKTVPLNKGGNRGLCFFYGMRKHNPLFPPLLRGTVLRLFPVQGLCSDISSIVRPIKRYLLNCLINILLSFL